MTLAGQNVSAPADGPRYATAGGGVYTVLAQPPAQLRAATTSTVAKTTTVRGFEPHGGTVADFFAPASGVFYGYVRPDNAAAADRATFEGGRWLAKDGAVLPSGVLLFSSAPAARGWMVAHMGATTRVYVEHTEPMGVTP